MSEETKVAGPILPQVKQAVVEDAVPAAAEKKEPTTPWAPASRLDVPQSIKDKYLVGFRGRFVRIADLPRKREEGWEVVKLTDEEKKLVVSHHIRDGSPLGNVVQKNELILCRMPESLAKSRDAYFEKKTGGKTEAVVSDFREVVPTHYGKGMKKDKI